MAWKNLFKVGVGVAVLGAIALRPSPLPHVGPLGAYPDTKLTPGLVATSDYTELTAVGNCGTYSQCHRQTTQATKDAVCQEYPANCKGVHEIDHFCPLALGCADDKRNLWAQPEHLVVNGFDYGFHTKDRLETLMVSLMKGKQITPQDAQQCILQDWVACYRKYVVPVYGSSHDVTPDPDDE